MPVSAAYALAFLITITAVGIRVMLSPWLADRLPLITLFPAIAISVWLGGYRAALVPAVIGYLACNYFFPVNGDTFPLHTVTGIVTLVTYATSTACIIWFGEAMCRAREESRRQGELLRVTLESIGDAVITTDVEGRVTSMNHTAVALTGWPEQDAFGEPLTEVFHIVSEDTGLPVPNPVSGAIGENKIVGLANHTILIARDGHETAIDDSAAPIRDAQDAVVGGVLVFRGIDARRQAEKALKESETRHRFLADLVIATQDLTEADEIMATTARMLALHMDVNRCAYAEMEEEEGESICVITGDYTRDVPSIVGRWAVADFGPEVVRCMAENKPCVFDDVDTDPRAGDDLSSYRETHVRAFICVPLHKAGRLTACMAVHQNEPRHWTRADVELVTTVVGRCWESLERGRSDRELKETAERLVLALVAARLGDWRYDLTTDVVDMSPRAAEIFGIPPGPVMTWEKMSSLLHEDEREATRIAVGRAVATRGQYDTEYRVILPSAAEVWVSSKGRAVYDANGKPVRMLGVVQDITATKLLENHLREQTSQLEEADRKKDDFIALLAHELRNPLAPIRAGLDILRFAGPDDEHGILARGMMGRQLGHMVRLIDDLLDVSRITRNKLLLQTRPVLLSEAIAHAVESSGPALEDAGCHLEVSLPGQPVWLNGDLTRLTQVFGNILANAAKFSEKGGRITLSADVENDSVSVFIKDAGQGIAPGDLIRVFDMFVQSDRHRGHSRGGLGIGLCLVKALVEMHGGGVTAASQGVGLGSTFTVTLPVAPESGNNAEVRSTVGPPPGSAFAGRRVLVVDDNEDAGNGIGQLLAIRGATVEVVYSGHDAVSAVERFHPEVLLMDVGMPGMNGHEATAAIRALSLEKQPLVIALTGWGRDEDRRRSRDAGCDGHVVKPVNLDQLEELLKSLV